jgi:hypothetical protein
MQMINVHILEGCIPKTCSQEFPKQKQTFFEMSYPTKECIFGD